LFFLGRENFLDYRDRKSDLEFGIKTLYYYFPDNLGLSIAFGLMILAAFLSIFAVEGDINLILAITNFVYSSLMVLYFLRKKEIWIIRKGTLLTILFFILSLYLPPLGI
jgi:4-hydroxybenzoate polyprenyltransferase